jgi:hypothetical protein
MKTLLISVVALLIAPSAQAAQYVYPAKGQDAARQAADEAECSTWATQQTGFDPAKSHASTSAMNPLAGASSAGLSGTAASAAVGALTGGGGFSADSAASLLGAGAGQGGTTSQAAALLNQATGSKQHKQKPGQAEFDQARAACLGGRGYSVK